MQEDEIRTVTGCKRADAADEEYGLDNKLNKSEASTMVARSYGEEITPTLEPWFSHRQQFAIRRIQCHGCGR